MDKAPAETATTEAPEPPSQQPAPKLPSPTLPPPTLAKEIGGVDGPEPTRYGDWQHKGRVTDF
jgi:homeobox protein ESX1